MSRRQHLVQVIQKLAGDEAGRQPSAEDWLRAHDKAGREAVNPADEDGVRSWAKALDVPAEQVVDAAAVVGMSADAIREHLRKASRG